MELQTVETKTPAKIQDYPVNAIAATEAARRSGFPLEQLATILKNRNRRVSQLPRDSSTGQYLLGSILKLAQTYGASKEVSPTIQAECVKILRGQFGSMSMQEVWLAYRLHSSGALPDAKGKGEMWGGSFTAKNFASVLAAWKEHRKKAVAEYENEKVRIESEREEAARAEKMKAEFWPRLVAKLEALRADDATDWRDCPGYICDALRNAEKLELSAEVWKPIWEDALELAKFEIETERLEGRGGVRVIGELAKATTEQATEKRAKVIARKITVFRCVVKNKDFDILELLQNG